MPAAIVAAVGAGFLRDAPAGRDGKRAGTEVQTRRREMSQIDGGIVELNRQVSVGVRHRKGARELGHGGQGAGIAEGLIADGRGAGADKGNRAAGKIVECAVEMMSKTGVPVVPSTSMMALPPPVAVVPP